MITTVPGEESLASQLEALGAIEKRPEGRAFAKSFFKSFS
jgi:hypothetical protein